jgi:hypothetical protein
MPVRHALSIYFDPWRPSRASARSRSGCAPGDYWASLGSGIAASWASSSFFNRGRYDF